MLGLFSRGPLSNRELHSNDGSLGVEYQAFHRNGSSNALVIRLKGQTNAVLEVELGGDWLEGFEVQTLQPPPMRSAGAGQGIEALEQIKFAIIERNGKISVIAKEPS